ncbi:MAG: GNAT family N-acetyltransferase [Bdellovibrionales bacterium]|nr:GNAT family N-acetyltransferase [Bdellovibrionales bacterium]
MTASYQIACIHSGNKLHDEWMLYISPRFLTYTPKHEIFIKTQNYTLKTANHLSELVELFRMRHHIFFNETGITDDHMLDLDQFDSLCDHLVIRSNATGEICGTYRMLSSENTKTFYSQGEFNLDDFLKVDGTKLELGRACIHPEHRNGSVIDLLWKGIGEYAKRTNASYLFGCSSIMTVSPVLSKAIIKTLKSNQMTSDEFKIRPRSKYKMSLSNVTGEDIFDEKYVMSQVPSLLRSYVNAGAKIFGKPALDKEFQCIDFFTILNLKELNSSYEKRYFKKMDT